MIVPNRSKKDFHELLDVIQSVNDEDFYITKNNERKFVNNAEVLLDLLKESKQVFYENLGKSKGVVLVWKSLGGEKSRNYIKILANSKKTASNLLTVLLWNTNSELFVKIRKNSPYLSSFKESGFKFLGGRGTQILMVRKNDTLRG